MRLQLREWKRRQMIDRDQIMLGFRDFGIEFGFYYKFNVNLLEDFYQDGCKDEMR